MNEAQAEMWLILTTPIPEPKSQLIRNNGKYYELWVQLA